MEICVRRVYDGVIIAITAAKWCVKMTRELYFITALVFVGACGYALGKADGCKAARSDQTKIWAQIELLKRVAGRIENKYQEAFATKPTELCDVSVCGDGR